jgi:O-antigen/teichoic acid export membrane protein
MLDSLRTILRDELRPGPRRLGLLRAAGATSMLRVAGAFLGLVASLFYARTLGAHGYGLYSYVIAWVTVLTIPVGLGYPFYLVREGATSPGSIGTLQRWSDRRIALSGTAAAAVLACAFFIPAAAGARWLFVAAAPLPLLTAMGSVRSALLQSLGRMVQSQWPRLILTPVVTLCALGLLWWWREVLRPIDLVFATLATTSMALCINHVQLHWAAPVQAAPACKPKTKDALAFMWVSGLYLLNSRTDLIMVGTLKGAHDAGIYAVAARVAEVTSFMMTTANVVLAPQVAKLHHQGDHALLQRMVRAANKRILLVSAPIAIALLVFAEPLLVLLFGAEFAGGALVLQILVVAQLLVVGSGSLGLLLNMTGHERALASNMMVAVALNVVLNLALIPLAGAVGAALATSASLVFSRILLWRQVRNRLGIELRVN